MGISNSVPVVQTGTGAKAFAFPFQAGSQGFPAYAEPTSSVFASIRALLMTGKNERIMRVGLGVDLHSYIFRNMTAIDRVQLSASVAQEIEENIRGVSVTKISIGQIEGDNPQSFGLIFDIEYRFLGQDFNQQIEYMPTSEGV